MVPRRALDRFTTCILAVFAGSAMLTRTASAASLTYTELANNATQLTTNSSPLSINFGFQNNPYGGHTITPVGNGWMISFAPAATFASNATNASGGMSQETDGQIAFVLNFDTAVHLSATIVEGGTYAKTGNGTVKVMAGGIISQAEGETHGNFNLVTNFAGDGTWTGTTTFGSFANASTSYRFCIDNDLSAEAMGSATLGTAHIAKDEFSIFIQTDGGNEPSPGPNIETVPAAAPLPSALYAGLGLGTFSLLFRKRLTGGFSK